MENSKVFKTEQEAFWAGEFGDQYIERNQSEALLASNIAFFSKILPSTNGIQSVMEFGANIGMNLKALKMLLPNAQLSAVEINAKALAQLERTVATEKTYGVSILDFSPDFPRDLVLCKGILIHLNPAILPTAYDRIYESSKKYIVIAEYYNPAPVEINYRGHTGRLFKRDFCSEMMDRHRDLKLTDYGFAYRKDPNFPQDDITWFLLEKN